MKITNLTWILIGLLWGCQPEKTASLTPASYSPTITALEQKLCDSLGVETAIAQELKSKSKSNLSRLYYHFGKSYGSDGKVILSPDGYHAGLMVHTPNNVSEGLVDALGPSFRQQGYSLFVVDNNFGLGGDLDDVALVKDTSLANIVRLIGTEAGNYSIGNDSVISIVKSFASRFQVRLLGVSGDWISLRVVGGVSDWNALAAEIAVIAPDVVSQGSGSVAALASELQSQKQIYLWWD